MHISVNVIRDMEVDGNRCWYFMPSVAEAISQQTNTTFKQCPIQFFVPEARIHPEGLRLKYILLSIFLEIKVFLTQNKDAFRVRTTHTN